jgi:hypothetical protein
MPGRMTNTVTAPTTIKAITAIPMVFEEDIITYFTFSIIYYLKMPN